ncbi:MAG: hypothetical protein ACJAT4_000936 [Granulosicoccus sp.]|jgi:hypothetical protein
MCLIGILPIFRPSGTWEIFRFSKNKKCTVESKRSQISSWIALTSKIPSNLKINKWYSAVLFFCFISYLFF